MPYISKLVKRIAISLCAITVVSASACGAPDAEQVTEPEMPAIPAARVASVRLNPDSMQAAIGSRVRLVAEARSANGQLLLRERMTWSSSDSTIATVDSTGEVLLLNTGLVEITAAAQGTRGRGKIKVTNIVASVSVSPAVASIQVGQSVTLSAEARNSTGGILTGRAITWTSLAPMTATVSSTGVVTGVTGGTTQIVAAIDGISGASAMTVTIPPPPPTAATQVAMQTQPGGALSGALLAPQAVVTLRDANNQLVNSTAAVVVSIASGGGTLNGTTSVAAVGGVASFTNLSITGAAGPRTLRFASTGLTAVVSGTFSITEPTLPPPPAGVLFSSRWNAETGNTRNALNDGGTWDRMIECSGGIFNIMSVIGGSQVGWTRTPNVLRIQQRGSTACGNIERTQNTVAASTTHWGRFYFRNDETANGHWHPVTYNCCGSIQMVPWTRFGSSTGVKIGVGTSRDANGTQLGYPYSLWFPGDSPGSGTRQLQNGRWYRYEWELRYLTPTSYRIYPRIYEVDGTVPLYDYRNFYQNDNSGGSSSKSLATWYEVDNRAFGITDPALARNFGFGNEGPGGSTASMGSWYIADFALGTAGWIGQ
jgi:hypothetical protein